MQFVLTFYSVDFSVVSSLMKGSNLSGHKAAAIQDGAEITYVSGGTFADSESSIRKFLVAGVTAITLNIVSSYIYDQLKGVDIRICQIDGHDVVVDYEQLKGFLESKLAGTGEQSN